MVQPVSLDEVNVILLDIEGTTTSISFVKDTLFPYARQHLAAYLKTHWQDKDLQHLVHNLTTQSTKDVEENLEGAVAIPPQEPEDDDNDLRDAIRANVLWQMDRDRKSTPLKELQGRIWRKGYQDGHIIAHLYEDVPGQMKRWKALGKLIYSYSSGSCEAQKLLFGHTPFGDLNSILSGLFDTTVGPKMNAKSYQEIAKQLRCQPREILFLTDIPLEAEAAKECGVHAVLVVRPGNAPLQEEEKSRFPVIHNFLELK